MQSLNPPERTRVQLDKSILFSFEHVENAYCPTVIILDKAIDSNLESNINILSGIDVMEF